MAESYAQNSRDAGHARVGRAVSIILFGVVVVGVLVAYGLLARFA